MIDLVKLHFRAGKGGDGRLSFLRQKFMPKGGPDGGDGGHGGSVYLVGRKELNTLRNFSGKKEFSAEDGQMGGKQNMTGHKGEDLFIDVPVGTVIWKLEETIAIDDYEGEGDFFDEKKQEVTHQALGQMRLDDIAKTKVGEILQDGEKFLLCKGGKGGRGNEYFKSSRNTTPMEIEKGEAGEEMEALFELKLLADVGLVGLPNAGKSTFLSLVTKANPRIANYPFTTLEPNLGVMAIGEGREVVIADIPGLIEGASSGKGLGTQFLRHVERCRVLMFVLFLDEQVIFDDGLSNEEKVRQLVQQYRTLEQEIKEYSPKLLELPWFVSVSKADLYNQEMRAEIVRQLRVNKIHPVIWSGVTREGLEEVRLKIQKLVD